MFFIDFIAAQKKKIILGENQIVKIKIFICEVSLIILLICQKLELVGPIPQKSKLPLWRISRAMQEYISNDRNLELIHSEM